MQHMIKKNTSKALLYLFQDFALDPDESRMRISAHHMIRSLTAGMVMITCRDPLFLSILTNLRTAFVGALRVRLIIDFAI